MSKSKLKSISPYRCPKCQAIGTVLKVGTEPGGGVILNMECPACGQAWTHTRFTPDDPQ